MSVGSKVRRWRVGKGLSVRAAAKVAKVSHPTWRDVENDNAAGISVTTAARFVLTCEGFIELQDFVPPSLRVA